MTEMNLRRVYRFSVHASAFVYRKQKNGSDNLRWEEDSSKESLPLRNRVIDRPYKTSNANARISIKSTDEQPSLNRNYCLKDYVEWMARPHSVCRRAGQGNNWGITKQKKEPSKPPMDVSDLKTFIDKTNKRQESTEWQVFLAKVTSVNVQK